MSAGFLVLGVSTTVALGLGLLHHAASKAITRHVNRALDDRCPVVVLSAHRAARRPGSNVALIRARQK